MPIYEYECTPCGAVHAIRHGMKDPPATACPTCRGPLRRLISAPHLLLARFSSPTEARYAKMTAAEEIAREKDLQKDFESIMLPGGVRG